MRLFHLTKLITRKRTNVLMNTPMYTCHIYICLYVQPLSPTHSHLLETQLHLLSKNFVFSYILCQKYLYARENFKIWMRNWCAFMTCIVYVLFSNDIQLLMEKEYGIKHYLKKFLLSKLNITLLYWNQI